MSVLLAATAVPWVAEAARVGRTPSYAQSFAR